ncbi:MAG: hypothetical protein V4557_00545 [Bacteroidota bacterium]
MSRFVIHISEAKRKKHLIWGSLNIATAVFLFGTLIYYLFHEDDTIRKTLYIVFTIHFSVSGYEYLQKRKRKEFFLEIDQDALTWSMHETEKPTSIQWGDIRWVKKEKNEVIMIFRESSFSVGFPLADFQEEEKMQILELIEQYAAQRQIRMINFSMPALATA